MNCDPIARCYRWVEYQPLGRVLALGDGDGRALAALLRANSGAAIDYVDLSPRMVELARARAGSPGARAFPYR